MKKLMKGVIIVMALVILVGVSWGKLSPTEIVKNITYRSDSKGIASGYTQNGNIYYLKQKMMPGTDVVHSKVLVLIYPPSEQKKVSTLINIVKDW